MNTGLRAEDNLSTVLRLCETIWGPKIIYCAHQIEARVARSGGDSARFFQKSGRSTPSLLGITQGLEGLC